MSSKSWSDDLLLKVVNVVTYAFLLGSNTYSAVAPHTIHGRESYLTPASYFFQVVWGLTNALLLGYIVLQFFPSGHDPVVNGVGWRFSGIALLNSLYVHLYARDHTILAFVASLFLAAVLSHAFVSLQQERPKTLPARLLVALPFSIWHAFSTVLVFVSAFAAFGRTIAHPAGIWTDIFVCAALAVLASTAVGYSALNNGDLAGALTLTWFLFGVFSEHRHPAVIHWFALGAALVALVATLKSFMFAFRRDGAILASDSERAPLVGSN